MKIEDLEEKLNKRIIEAYAKGYSVVEITRALRKTSVEFVHSLLRDTGHIPVMERSDYRRHYDIDPRLTKAFRAKGFSFGRWCLGWRFDPAAVTADLKSVPEKENESAAHSALKRDFPDTFHSMYDGKKTQKEKKKRLRPHPDSLRIDWNVERKTFIASVTEFPGIEADGKDWDDAFFALKSAYRLHEYTLRLDRLVENQVTDGMAR
jgi:predicted RNase H-like HicB family nuclease